jgi:glutamine amidotransferase
MCLAIYKPRTTQPDREAYLNGFKGNDHGAGFAAAVNGGLVVAKGFFKFVDFWSAFEPYVGCDAIIHFRWATHGHRDEGNCHPFTVSDDLAMIHNGILDIDTKADKTKSDTWHYVESVLKPIHADMPEFYNAPALRFMGEQGIGAGNKFIFLRADGDVGIWNEDSGLWTEDGHWYSNGGFRPSQTRFSYNFTTWDDDWTPNGGTRGGILTAAETEAAAAGPDELTLFEWSDDVPPGLRWIADELLDYGYTEDEIERGFAADPEMMREHFEELEGAAIES